MKKLALATIASAFVATSFVSTASAGDYRVVVNETPKGGYTASLVHRTEMGKNQTVGTYETRKEARKAGKEAKKEIENQGDGK